MVFIRPTILRSEAEARALAERRYNYVRAQQRLLRPDEEPSIDQLVRDYTNSIAEAESAVAQTIGNLRLMEQDHAEDIDADLPAAQAITGLAERLVAARPSLVGKPLNLLAR